MYVLMGIMVTEVWIHRQPLVDSRVDRSQKPLCWPPTSAGTTAEAGLTWILQNLNVTTPRGLSVLNDLLASRSYLVEWTFSSADVRIAKRIQSPVDRVRYPHVCRWHRHIRALMRRRVVPVPVHSNKKEKRQLVTLEISVDDRDPHDSLESHWENFTGHSEGLDVRWGEMCVVVSRNILRGTVFCCDTAINAVVDRIGSCKGVQSCRVVASSTF